MKRSLYCNLLLALTLALTGSAGCKRKPKTPTPIPPVAGRTGTGPGATTDSGIRITDAGTGPVGQPVDTGTVPGVGTGPGGMTPLAGDLSGMKEDAEIFKANTVYFDFDRSTVRSSERSKIEAVAAHLKANPTHGLKVEGHCDERGTEGYNMSLGERRALAVREYLLNLGLTADRVTTISYGEARPAVPGSSEKAWSKNRRCEFILLTP